MQFYKMNRIAIILLSFLGSSKVIADFAHALVIGIDKYKVVGELDGAVNDARDVAAALRKAGVKDVTLLVDRQVTKKRVVDEWNRMIQKTNSGDTIIFTYAGHGSVEPEHVKGSEKTGKDQNLLFPKFDPRTTDNAERLIDNEIALMIKNAAEKNLSIVMVIDACHSGTMTRGVDTRVRKFKMRAAKYPAITEDHLAPVDKTAAYINLADQKELLYFGAVQDHELAPEIEIDGKAHGALSVSFARGLNGAADTNRNGVITADELEKYVSNSVQTLMEGQQHPSLMRGSAIDLVVPIGGELPKPVNKVSSIAMQIINPDNISITDLSKKLEGVTMSENPNNAILTWDVRRGHLLNKLGDIVAYANERAIMVPPPPATRGFARNSSSANYASKTTNSKSNAAEQETINSVCDTTKEKINCNGLDDINNVQKVIEKWKLVEEIRQNALQNPLTIKLKPEDQLYHKGDNVVLNVAGQNYNYFTLFNLGSDGTVNFLYPLKSENDPLEMPVGKDYQLNLTVEPPFGGDHFIAIASKEPLIELHRDLANLNNKQAARELSKIFKRNIESKTFQIGIHGVYTSP